MAFSRWMIYCKLEIFWHRNQLLKCTLVYYIADVMSEFFTFSIFAQGSNRRLLSTVPHLQCMYTTCTWVWRGCLWSQQVSLSQERHKHRGGWWRQGDRLASRLRPSSLPVWQPSSSVVSMEKNCVAFRGLPLEGKGGSPPLKPLPCSWQAGIPDLHQYLSNLMQVSLTTLPPLKYMINHLCVHSDTVAVVISLVKSGSQRWFTTLVHFTLLIYDL